MHPQAETGDPEAAVTKALGPSKGWVGDGCLRRVVLLNTPPPEGAAADGWPNALLFHTRIYLNVVKWLYYIKALVKTEKKPGRGEVDGDTVSLDIIFSGNNT